MHIGFQGAPKKETKAAYHILYLDKLFKGPINTKYICIMDPLWAFKVFVLLA